MRKPLTAAERNAIVGVAMVAPNTVRRWEAGQPIRHVSRVRIEAAIERLNSAQETQGQGGVPVQESEELMSTTMRALIKSLDALVRKLGGEQ
jgi:hypothetical protein